MGHTATWRVRPRTLVALGVAVVLFSVLGAMSAVTVAWGDQLRTEGRLLPGTTIATVEVGGSTVEEATEAVREHLAERLDRELTVQHGETIWTTTPRELGAVTDVEAAVAEALASTESAGFGDLVRLRWAGGTADVRADVGIDIPDAGIVAFVAGIADEVDLAAVDARAVWDEGQVVVTEETIGRAVDRAETVARLQALFDTDDDTVDLAVADRLPTMRTDLVQAVAADVDAATIRALDHEVTVELAGESRVLSPRELGLANDAADVLAASLGRAMATGEVDVDAVRVTVGDAVLDAVLDEVAGPHEVVGRDAEITWHDGRFTIRPERTGRHLPRADARERLRAALGGETDTVALELVTTRPRVTADSFGTVLLLDQRNRELHLYRGAERAGSWPVAVGTNNAPTPTGTFVVGAKRFEPTWVNPAPDRWGADMPDAIGPGPDNPLGPRALNWNTKGGRDTLIRFHGTPNPSSVGTASSNGCVRMFNEDVIELYDLVSSGTTIVSVG